MVARRIRISNRTHLTGIVFTFFVSGAIGAGLLSWLTARARFGLTWFTPAEWWTFPTAHFWLASCGLFFFAFVIAYFFCVFNDWLAIHKPRVQLVWALCLATPIPVAMIALSRTNSPLVAPLLSPVIVGFFLSLAMFVLTRRWYRLATVLIIVIYVAAPLIADVPDLLLSGGYRWFDAVTYLIRYSLLASVCGWWLAQAAGSSASHH